MMVIPPMLVVIATVVIPLDELNRMIHSEHQILAVNEKPLYQNLSPTTDAKATLEQDDFLQPNLPALHELVVLLVPELWAFRLLAVPELAMRWTSAELTEVKRFPAASPMVIVYQTYDRYYSQRDKLSPKQ
jgi:hypothetical protein